MSGNGSDHRPGTGPVPARVRVLVVDDQTLVRNGVRSLLDLSGDVNVVGEARDGREALAAIDGLAPDVVLLDLRMPVLDGLGVLNALAERDRAPAVIVLTTFDDDEALFRAMRLGARGYLLKDVTLDQLVEAIKTVAGGGSLIQPAVTEALLRRLGGGAASGGGSGAADRVIAPEPLTGREEEILRLMAGGFSNREIADALFLSTGTVKNHVSAILTKLGVRDRTRAVLRGLELGLVSR